MPRRALLVGAASVGCTVLSLSLFGCSDDGTITVNPNATPMAQGNWQVSSSAGAAAKLPVFSGSFAATSGKVSATLHSQAASACVAPDAPFTLTGTESDKNVVTLSGPVAGGTLSLTGTLAEDGRSLGNATYSIKGGSCAFAEPAAATAQNFAPVTGVYAGNFAGKDGQLAQVSANFSQSSTPDANGDFTLAGTATVSNNPCFPTAVPVSATQVTGGMFTFTYSANGNSVTAQGTFAPDASTLAVTGWTSSGTCGADTGVASTMTRQ
jgi:hypothetical protein